MQEWPKGSLEETVQNAVKSWEMELSHKTRLQDFRTINPEKFKLIVNGTVYNYQKKKKKFLNIICLLISLSPKSVYVRPNSAINSVVVVLVQEEKDYQERRPLRWEATTLC